MASRRRADPLTTDSFASTYLRSLTPEQRLEPRSRRLAKFLHAASQVLPCEYLDLLSCYKIVDFERRSSKDLTAEELKKLKTSISGAGNYLEKNHKQGVFSTPVGVRATVNDEELQEYKLEPRIRRLTSNVRRVQSTVDMIDPSKLSKDTRQRYSSIRRNLLPLTKNAPKLLPGKKKDTS